MARKKRKSKKRGKAGVKGGKHHTVYNNREHVLPALKRQYGNTPKAYAITNAGHTKAGRKRMARKAARTRKRRGR